MSWLNGAELIMNFAPETEQERAERLLTEAAQAARDIEVRDITDWIQSWREANGYDATTGIYPEGWPVFGSDEEQRTFMRAAT